MRLLLLISIFFVNNLFADLPTDIINRNIKDLEQKKIFEKQQKNINIKENKTYDMKSIEVNEDAEEEGCIEIEEINVRNSTIFDKDDFEDLTNKYLNNCNGLKNLSNLKDKISNMYIDKGYVTSRAFLKPQDLSSGSVNIDILEGKIEYVESVNINSSNLYSNFKNKILNLRDLEVVIKQGERLQSQFLSLQLVPGTKVGYTIVKITNQKNGPSYHGNIGLNNFGTENTGKYQIYNNFVYENLLNINDILNLNLNSTNKIIKNNNNTLGGSLSYSFPYNRFLFNISYDYSTYKQLNIDEFTAEFQSKGTTNNLVFDTEYKLYHTKQNTFDLLFSYQNKKTENLLNGVKLALQSDNPSSVALGFRHTYLGKGFDYYSNFMINKGLKNKENANFLKYILDLGYNKYFETNNNLRYNFSFRGQYSDDELFGTEEISMGGIYSVRGFNDTGLSGNTGFYVRNELNATYTLNSMSFSPYLGLDIGYVPEKENFISSNIGGKIVGGAIGVKSSWNKLNFEIFYNQPLKDSLYTKRDSKEFTGVSFTYKY